MKSFQLLRVSTCIVATIFFVACSEPYSEPSSVDPTSPEKSLALINLNSEQNVILAIDELPEKNLAAQIIAPNDLTITSNVKFTQVDIGQPIIVEAFKVLSIDNDAPSNGFQIGLTRVIWTIVEESGEETNVYQNIRIEAFNQQKKLPDSVGLSSPNNQSLSTSIPPLVSISAPMLVPVVNTAENNAPTVVVKPSATANDIVLEATGLLTKIELTKPVVKDLPGIIRFSNDAPIDGFFIGTTLLNWTIENDRSQSVNLVQSIIIVDTTPPTLTIPTDLIVEGNGDTSLTKIDIGRSSASDVVNNLLIIVNDEPTNGFPVGETIVTWSVKDDVGNLTTAEQRILVTVACNSYIRIFKRDVWPVLENNCKRCHNINGSNTPFNLLDANSLNSNFHQINFDTFRSIASKTDFAGKSLLLVKPINANGDHGGGQVLDKEGNQIDDINRLITALQACNENPAEQTTIVRLSAEQRLRKIVLSLAGRLPTAEEYASLNTAIDPPAKESVISFIIDNTMSEPGFFQKLSEIYNDLLLTNYYAEGTRGLNVKLDNFENKDYFKNDTLISQGYTKEESRTIRHNASLGIALAPIELVKYVVRNDKPYSEILTANYVLVNPYSAAIFSAVIDEQADFAFKYGDDPNTKDPNDFRVARLFDKDGGEIPHAGLLNTVPFLNRYPSSNTNINRHRSKIVFKYFLGIDVEGLADRATLDFDNVIGNFPTLEDPQCSICHNVIDPVAGLFKNWNNTSVFRGDNGTWLDTKNPPEMLVPGYTQASIDQLPSEKSDSALQWLSSRIVTDSRFSLATVHTLFGAFIGQSTNADTQFIEDLKNQFIQNDFSLKLLIKSILISDYFIASNAGATQNASVSGQNIDNIGTGRLLGPEQLHRKILATTNGYQWASPSKRNLLDKGTYNLMYGGIDSDGVVSRTTEPTGLMAAIKSRVAKQSACEVTTFDFAKPAINRALFPFVEITDLPDTVDGSQSIKKNIQYLYQQILSEKIEIDDVEMQNVFELFIAVRNLSNNDLIVDECRSGLGKKDPIIVDVDHSVKSWMTVMNFLFLDYKFLYE